jgi:hypothetical protein
MYTLHYCTPNTLVSKQDHIKTMHSFQRTNLAIQHFLGMCRSVDLETANAWRDHVDALTDKLDAKGSNKTSKVGAWVVQAAGIGNPMI